MNKKILNAVPYIALVLAIGFTIHSSFLLQNAENSCNEHLKTQYEKLISQVSKFCPVIEEQITGPSYIFNASNQSWYDN